MTLNRLPREVRFIRLLARRLHEYGAAAHRLEGAVSSVAQRLGLSCEVFSTPTSVFLTFTSGGEEAVPTQLLRLNPGSANVGKLCRIDAVAEAVAAGEMDLDEGAERLLAIPDEPAVVSLPFQLLAWGGVGIAVAALFGSTWVDIAVAAVLAMLTGLLAMRLGVRWHEAGSFEPITAFLITVAAYLGCHLLGGAMVANVVIASLIILMPGLDLTIAINELSTGHLASGTARFAGATVILLKLSLGVVLATQLMQKLGYSGEIPVDPASLSPGWFTWAAVVVAGFAFAVLFNAEFKDWWAVALAAVTAYATSFFATQWLGSEGGVFVAAFVIAALSNAYGRVFNRPSAVMRLPGIILLVPGSLGYRALTLLFSKNLDEGLVAAVSVAIVLASLVGGLLLGNTLIPPRRNL